jgi:hypothetical protein
MSTTDNKQRTRGLVAVLGALALLMWLSWGDAEPVSRGGGRGDGRDRERDRDDHEGDVAALDIWTRADDRILIGPDRVEVDLATAVSFARGVGRANVHVTGDTRHGWFETVKRALSDAGVDVFEIPLPRAALASLDSDIPHFAPADPL